MDSLMSDARFFNQVSASSSSSTTVSWKSGINSDEIASIVTSLLGDASEINRGPAPTESNIGGQSKSMFEMLTWLLPSMFSQRHFFWHRVASQFASMLHVAAFPPTTQCTFLTFTYARLLGLMGPEQTSAPGSLMTVDGSPVELSWIIPSRHRPAPGEVTRQLRFAIEPIDPRDGTPLQAAAVMNFFASSFGGLGIVRCDDEDLEWAEKSERFLYPNLSDAKKPPVGSRFFVGFDFNPAGTLTLKAYYITPPRPSPGLAHHTDDMPFCYGDTDFTPMRKLVDRLHPSMKLPLETLISYIQGLDAPMRPRFQILAVDGVKGDINRLKIYCRTMEGSSWLDVKRSLTMGGRLASPTIKASMMRLEILWNELFPMASSQSRKALEEVHSPPHHTGTQGSFAPHPTGGLVYYYELVSGQSNVFSKIYLPVGKHCPNDLFVANAVERFYNHPAVNIKSSSDDMCGGWVSHEVAEINRHRPLEAKSGAHTYIAFGLKKTGWDMTSYFSPEVWERLKSDT